MELGLQIADFNWKVGTARLGAELTVTAQEAESAGISRISVMDHLWQIAPLGPPENYMLEAYATLGFLAACTKRVLLHTLVTGVVYREPGLLAKLVSTIDVLSGGRAGLGIGAAWYQDEAEGLGVPFPATAERFERLEEAVQICLEMWADGDAPYTGKHYSLGRTLNSPQPLRRPRPYLMIGGGGEKKTLRMVARYADACNLARQGAAGKLDVLRAHCEREGRDYDDIEKTVTMQVTPETTSAEIVEQLEMLHALGFSVAYVLAKHSNPRALVETLAQVQPAVSTW
ncbi:LLM class F420-dependent oxidoreductase [Amycolatopsis orientalis]|uniref:LLM class F420-dependent oxidoreductase n=1 Tax=Amycolatopsis orientalis TaxID=31958 RepID=A0A193CBB7_AMYOR|nr:LLM class F420-dependent oxidoreductase [Amycolatopsis orientalis]ANN21658.1 LLM class F420-dependent oxidoreductase [Amycolatopsis orientalis]